MESKIRLQLLAKQPVVLVDGTAPSLNPQALRLLIYLADRGETQFAREDLVRVLYAEETPDTRVTFRKRALFSVRQKISDSPVAALGDDVILFNAETTWVDSRVFERQAHELLQRDSVLRKEDFPAAKAALELYEAPFLAGYRPKPREAADTSRFVRWQKQRQSELETLYQQMLDLVIPYCLEQERTWGLAKHYALRWMESSKPGIKPLQYLIWLAHREQDNSLNTYLAELQSREEGGELPIGLSSSEWHRLLTKGRSIPLPRLLSRTDEPVDEALIPAVEPQINHSDALGQILSLLTSPRERRPFAVTGLPGVGKTETARSAARLLRERYPEYTVVVIELSPYPDLERLTNAILHALGKHDLLSQNYPQKRQRLRQLLQAPNVVVILDEGHTTQFAHQESLDTTLKLVDGATVMLLARELPRFDHYVLELQGLDTPQAADFLVNLKPWLRTADPLLLRQLVSLTRGLPLLLHLVAGGLSRGQNRLQSLIERLTEQPQASEAAPDIYTMYERVLNWLWHGVANQDKDLLYALSLFAPSEGADEGEIRIGLSRVVPEDRLQSQLEHLVNMRLVIEDDRDATAIRYRMHPIILDFVRRRARRPYAQRIEESYVRYILNFAATYSNEFTRLDEHQHNIFQMLDLTLFDEHHLRSRAEAIEVLNLLYPYFEQRGLYSKAGELFTHVRLNVPIEAPSVRAQLLFYCGKLENTRAKYESALELFTEARGIEETLSSSKRLGAIYHAIGNIYLHTIRYPLAMENFERAETWAQDNHQDILLYSIWSNMGLCMFRQNQYEDAKRYYKRVAVALGDDLSSQSVQLQTIGQYVQNALGVTYVETGDYVSAEAHFQKSLELAGLTGNPELIGQLNLSLGLTYLYTKQYDAARNSITQARLIAEQIQSTPMRIQSIADLAAVASAQLQQHEAFHLFRTALIEVENYNLLWIKPYILVDFGKALLRSELYDAALRCFADTLALPSVTPVNVSQALYGFSLSVLMKVYRIGNNDMSASIALIGAEADLLSLRLTSYSSVVPLLSQAHEYFQRDLDQLPELSRYRIEEALETLITAHA